MSVTINGTNGLTFNDNTTQATSPFAGGLGFRNRIINGDMRISQRGTSFSLSSSAYTLDRWQIDASGGGAFSIQQSSDAPTGFSNSMLITVTTADSSIAAGDYYILTQRIEGFNVADLGFGSASVSPVAISFWVKGSVVGTYAVSILAFNAAYRTYLGTITINSANTWEQKSLVVSGDTASVIRTNNNWGLGLAFDLGCGSTFNGTAGSWVAGEKYGTGSTVKLISTLNATLQITGVQLEKGSTATSFDYRDYGREEILCRRYLNAYGGDGINDILAFGTMYSTTQGIVGVPFPVPMRATPTLSVSSVSHWRAELSGVGNTVCSALVLDSISNSRVAAVAATFGSNASFGSNKCFSIIQNATSSARMFFSAEL